MSLRASVEHETFSSTTNYSPHAKNCRYPFSVLARVRVYLVVTYHNVCVSELGINVPAPVFLPHFTLCLHFVAARDAETRRAQQQQQERQQKNNNETNATESGSNGERRVKASTFMSTSPKEGKAVLGMTNMWIS